MRKLFLLILVFICSVALGQGEVLKAHYPWEYKEPSDWVNIHYCPKDEMLITATDSSDRYISFKCTVQSSGQYKVEVYGGNKVDSLINTQTINTNIEYQYQLPIGYGKPYGSNGYTQYKIRIYPTLTTKKVLTFLATKHPSSSLTNDCFLLVNINNNSLTSFNFAGNVAGITPINIKYVNFYYCININTLAYTFYACKTLVNVTFAKTCSEVTSLYNTFNSCSTMTYLKFPTKMDKVTTMAFCCKLMIKAKTIIMPQSAVLLNNVELMITECPLLETFIFPVHMDNVTTLYDGWSLGFFRYSTLIKNVQMPLTMKKLTDMTKFLYQNTKITSLTLPDTLNNLTTIKSMLFGATSLTNVVMPRSMASLVDATDCFNGTTSLTNVVMPRSMPSLKYMETFIRGSGITSLTLPDTLNSVTTINGMYSYTTALTNVVMPRSMPSLKYMEDLIGNSAITSLTLPDTLNSVTTIRAMCINATSLTNITMPRSMTSLEISGGTSSYFDGTFRNTPLLKIIKYPKILNNLKTMQNCFQNAGADTIILPTSATSLVTLTNNVGLLSLDSISTCTFGTGMANVEFTFRDLKTFKQPTLRVSKFICTGQSLAVKSSIHTIDIDWANSTYGGTTPQIDIRWNSLSATTLDAIFTALPVVVGKTINVAGNPGSATCTPTIASLKGWTVIII